MGERKNSLFVCVCVNYFSSMEAAQNCAHFFLAVQKEVLRGHRCVCVFEVLGKVKKKHKKLFKCP